MVYPAYNKQYKQLINISKKSVKCYQLDFGVWKPARTALTTYKHLSDLLWY